MDYPMDERRLHQRIEATLPCRTEHSSRPAETVNVSLRGIFVASQDLPAPGAELPMHVSVEPGAEAVSMRCVVTWTSTGLAGDGFPRGFGAKIIWMKAADWSRWIAFISRLQDSAPAT